jgi:hypothetical protein
VSRSATKDELFYRAIQNFAAHDQYGAWTCSDKWKSVACRDKSHIALRDILAYFMSRPLEDRKARGKSSGTLAKSPSAPSDCIETSRKNCASS